MEPGFLAARSGPVFYLYYPPAAKTSVRGGVLFIPPFAEELNKARRMVALQARRFAAAGFAVMVPDLYGCGDSGGDFGDARWPRWQADLRQCLDWLSERTAGPLHLWCLRAGALLAPALEPRRGGALLLWQPALRGAQVLTQFLRLRLAASLNRGQKETTAELRAQLDAGQALEIAGYALHPDLAASLDAARLEPPPPGTSVYWFEVVAAADRPLLPASCKLIEQWADVAVSATTVVGETFWATQEISLAPTLLDASTACLSNGGEPAPTQVGS